MISLFSLTVKFIHTFISLKVANLIRINAVYKKLNHIGYRVWYDKANMGHDMDQSMVDGIKNSKIVIACTSSKYQERPNCMFELRENAK